jgi:pectate lyase
MKDVYIIFTNAMNKWCLIPSIILLSFTNLIGQQYYMATPQGYGAATTGGGNASPVTVTTYAALKTALTSSSSSVILVSGTIDFTSLGMIKAAITNKTLIGLPGSKFTNTNQSVSGILYLASGSDNVIIRNLLFQGPGAWDNNGNDNLTSECTNLWVDHCEFQDGEDGNFDQKKNSDNVTVSWCKFTYLKAPRPAGSGTTNDHRFSGLVGSSGTDFPSDGHYNVTFQNCYWTSGCVERMPRARNATLHMLNCYYDSPDCKVAMGIGGGTNNSSCYAESDDYSGISSSAVYKNYDGTDGGSVTINFSNCLNGAANVGTVAKPTYTYTVIPVAQVKTYIPNPTCGAGATLQVTAAGVISAGSGCVPGTNTPPTVGLTAPSSGSSSCQGIAITLTATASDADGSVSKVEFYDGTTLLGTATTSPYTFSWTNAAAGSHSITAKATDDGGLSTTSSIASVTVNTAPSAPTVSSPFTYCQNAAATALSATGTALKWYTVSTGGTGSATAPIPSTTAVGTTSYYVSQTISGCEGGRATLAVTVNAIPTTPTVSSPVTYCQNAAATALSATGTALKWYTVPTGGTGSATAPTPSTTAVGTTNYYVSQTISGCEGGRATLAVTVNAIPTTPTVSSPVTYCQNAAATALSATGTALKWYTVSTGGTGSATAPTPSTTAVGTTSYYVSQTISGCESPRSTIAVTVNAAATATITPGGATTFCQGGSVTLTANTGSSYIWFNGATQVGTNVSYTANSSGNYTVQVTNPSGCTGQVTSPATTVTVNATPSAPTVGGPVSYCQNATTTVLTATGTSLLWYTVSTGGTGSATAPTPSTTTAGTTNYYVSQTLSGCEGSRATIAVTVSTLPTATISASGPASFCQGGSVTLTASAGSSYIWFNGAAQVGTSSTYTAVTAGNYTVEVTNASGCKATSSATAVTVNALPAATITAGGPTSFCQGGSVTLTASAGSSYIWFNGAAQVGTSSTYTAVTAGNYTVEVTNASGCKATSSATTVTVNASSSATITASGNTTFCQGGSVTLTAGAGSSYIWFNGASQVGTASTYTAATAGNYTVEVTNASGCKATSSATAVTVNALPAASITAGGATTFSQGGSVVLSANTGTGLTYKWFNGPAQVGSNSTYTATTGGDYTVEVTNAAGCKAVSSVTTVTVTGNQAPAVNITFPTNNATFTAPANVTLTATATDADGTVTKVDFYFGNTLLGTDPTSPYNFAMNSLGMGSYTILAVATDNQGGTATSSSITFTVTNPLPTVSITAPSNGASFVESATIPITANAADANGTVTKVQFYNGSTLLGTDVTSPYSFTWSNVAAGTYDITAKATDNDGGVSTSSIVTITVTANQPSVITITSPTDNSTVTGNSVTINVTATDPDGGITLVEYLDGTTVIGSSTTQPYSFTWNNPSAGTHVITVRVTDSNGGVTTSTPTTVTVGTQTGIFTSSAYGTFTNVYPNPSLDVFTFKASEEIKSLSIVNMHGIEVSTLENIQAGELVEIGKDLAEGSFVLLIKYTSGRAEVGKLVKIK